MTKPTVKDRIGHILRSIEIIEGYWDGKSFSEYVSTANEPLRSATERHLLIIGEAAALSGNLIARQPAPVASPLPLGYLKHRVGCLR